MTMTDNSQTIQTMTPRQIGDVAIDWANREGWNPGLRDADAFHLADPEGFFMGVVDDEPASCISAVRYGQNFGFLGFYIVNPKWRGRGYGQEIWQHALEHLSGRIIGGDGVVEMQDTYRQIGMKRAHTNIRFQGQSVLVPSVEAQRCLVDVREIDFATLVAFDRAHFPADRETFLSAWLTTPGHTGYGFVEDGELRGYGIIRPCHVGYKIGPLFADDQHVARELYWALAKHSDNEPVFLDIPEPNAAGLALAKELHLEPVFETARLYIGKAPKLPMERIFGITTYELG
jgi:GNAT superfamily N-acetyltransferase